MKNDLKKISRIFGFNKDREGLISRYLNESENWKHHIDQCKNYILNSAETKQKGSCMILGSGWWIDLPVEDLHDQFDSLIFIDISHPNQIKLKARKYPKVKLITADVSGVLDIIRTKKFSGSADFLKLMNESFEFDLIEKAKPDFVVSLNLLSQIAYFPVSYIQKRKTLTDNESEKIREYIEMKHLEILPKNRSCLITDFYQYEYDSNDNLLSEKKRLQTDLDKNNSYDEWIWDFDLSGNYLNISKVKFKVAALQV